MSHVSITVNVHGASEEPPRVSIYDETTVCISFGRLMNGVTLFFGSVQEAADCMTQAIVQLTHAEFAYLNPLPPAPDAHLEADYDDRNGD